MNTYEGTELVEAYDYLFKVIVVGESGTGKSCLLHHFIHDTFKENSLHTIGVEFNSKVVRIGDKSVKLQIWDSAGQERFKSVTRSYYRGAAAAVLVYDITRRSSFTHLDQWLSDCRAMASPHLVVVLVGNKVDKEAEREVDYLEGLRWAEQNNVLFVETSSITGTNAAQPFLLIGQSIIVLMKDGVIDPDVAGTGVSYGERQLRAVGASGSSGGTGFGSRFSFASDTTGGGGSGRWGFGKGRGRRGSVNVMDMVGTGKEGREGKCC
ncbi:hypothetical protein QFC21_006109 [Naganishia friedmannii]|uniref:Uncharacterized protein n=1 Tax=Naganishia friedmannii TaxID=89922 RepID=A0ACC2V4J6_9TREE|nr:hypothetical protein QFC21_006109 [Naganishia friedmannii]